MNSYRKWLIVVFVVVLAGLGGWLYVIYSQVHGSAEDREVSAVGTLVNAQASHLVKASDFTSTDKKHLNDVFGSVWNAVQSPEYVRMKVWTPDYTVIWSNLPELIGQKFPPFDELKESGDEKIPVGDLESQKQENVGERQYDVLLETYVPFIAADGTVPGFIELYKVPTTLNTETMNDFEHALPLPIATAAIAFAILAFALRFMTGKKVVPPADAAHL